jgi:alpha/beta superfamily hydrolase
MSEKNREEKKSGKKELFSRFEEFVTTHPPAVFSRHLRCIFLDYLNFQITGGFPGDFEEYIGELYDFFELLDYATDLVESGELTLIN